MAEDYRRRDPDLSGVFTVGDDEIPMGVIKKPREPERRVSSYRHDAVLTRQPESTREKRAAATEENRRGSAARLRAEYEEEQRRFRADERQENRRTDRRVQAPVDVYEDDAWEEVEDDYEDDYDETPLRQLASKDAARRARRASLHEDAYFSSHGRETEEEDEDEEPFEESEEESHRRQQRQNARRRRKRHGVLRIVLPIVLVLVAAAGVGVYFLLQQPQIAVEPVLEFSIENYVEVDAVALSDPETLGDDHFYAVFIMNDYAEKGIAANCKVNLYYPDGRNITGAVTKLIDLPVSEALVQKILSRLPKTRISGEHNEIVAVLPDSSTVLADGDRLTAQVVTETSRNALTVPLSAVRTDGGETIVWVCNEKFGVIRTLERRTVTVGLMSNDKAEITDGVAKGEKVVVASSCAPTDLANGMFVWQKALSDAATTLPLTTAQDAAPTEPTTAAPTTEAATAEAEGTDADDGTEDEAFADDALGDESPADEAPREEAPEENEETLG